MLDRAEFALQQQPENQKRNWSLLLGHGTEVIYHDSLANQIPGIALYNDPVFKMIYSILVQVSL